MTGLTGSWGLEIDVALDAYERDSEWRDSIDVSERRAAMGRALDLAVHAARTVRQEETARRGATEEDNLEIVAVAVASALAEGRNPVVEAALCGYYHPSPPSAGVFTDLERERMQLALAAAFTALQGRQGQDRLDLL